MANDRIPGFQVALGGFAQPPFWFQLSVFSISAFA
jgi:hypothetical protein